MKEFEEGIDYKTLHLQWLAANKGYRPKGWQQTPQYMSYYDQMNQMYYSSDAVIKSQKSAYLWFRDDYRWQNCKSDIKQQAEDLFGKGDADVNEWFVTIGFNHQTFDPQKAHSYVTKLFEKEFVIDAYGTFEFHTETGEHPHFMFYLKSDCKTKGRVVDRIFQSAGSKKIILGKNFIDVRRFEARHTDYLNGNKSEDKMLYVQQDIAWRAVNNLPTIIKKNI